MTRKVVTKGIGQSIQQEKKREAERLRRQAESGSGHVEEYPQSLLQQSSLEELIDTVELRKESYAAAVGEAKYVNKGPALIPQARRDAAEQAASSRRELLSIPRRPAWHEGMSVGELAVLEAEAFMVWRRGLAVAVQEEGLHVTPYERNLDFWRQLWRCLERSDLVVQIVDARDPDFYYCRDLGRYLAELDAGKRLLLLANKADFLSEQQREHWAEHFASCGIDVVFFSALRELRKQQRRDMKPVFVGRASVLEQAQEEKAEEEEEEQEAEEEGRTAAALASDDRTSAVPRSENVEKSANRIHGDAVDLPVPGLDSSDDELGVGCNANLCTVHEIVDEQGKDEDEQEDNLTAADEIIDQKPQKDEDGQQDAPMGPLGEDDLTVADSQQLLEELASRLSARGVHELKDRVGSSGQPRLGTVGFVGYPNVGKSTVINALIGAKRVGMSGRPGKTKHIQTLELPELGMTLCDCPGLVFPSVVASREHLVVNNTVPIDDLRECFSPVALIIDKMGLLRVLEHYDCGQSLQEARKRCGGHELDDAHLLLAALAVSRGHNLRLGVPDENWAARKVLRDFVTGRLLHCEPPPTLSPDSSKAGAEKSLVKASAGNEDDFSDLDKFLEEAARKPRTMTKRKMRYLNKQRLKGGLLSGSGPAGDGAAGHFVRSAASAFMSCQSS